MNFEAVRRFLKPLTQAEADALAAKHGGVENAVCLDDVGLLELVRERLRERDRAVDVNIDEL